MNFDLSAITHSTEQTEELGEAVAAAMLDNPSLPRFVALFGDLGVGKTAFVRGFTKAIAPNARVKSPTFALVNEYKGTICSVFHFDMYRIEDEDELYSIGFYDYADRNGICLTEWSENILSSLPDAHIRVEIIKNDADNTDSRLITVKEYPL